MRVEYELEEERVRRFLRSRGARRAAVQLPEGLRRYAGEIAEQLGREGVEAVFLGTSCYGACDLAEEEARRAGADVLLHYGHADMGLPTSLPVLFVEARMRVSPVEAVIGAVKGEGLGRMGVVTTVQHVGFLPQVLDALSSLGFRPLVGRPGGRARYEGQVLGCDLSSASSLREEVEGFLYFGTGRFHPLAVHLATGKPVLAVNPLTGRRERISSPEEFLRRRRAVMMKAAGASSFAVVVSTKPGQARFGLAESLMERLRKEGRRAVRVVVDEVRPEPLLELGVEAAVCAACPWVPLDDAPRFELPLLTPPELLQLLEGREEYRLDSVEASDF